MAKNKKHDPPIFGVTEYFGNLVKLYASTWDGHVVVEHPEMIGSEKLVEHVLKNPYEIRESTLYTTGAAFISERGISSVFPEGIRVLVKYDDMAYEKGSCEGLVTTAYPVDLVNFQRPNLGKTIYRKKK